MPDWKPEIRKQLLSLNLAPTREAAIVEELAQHLEDYYAEWLALGATPADAERRTHAELSGSEMLQRQLRHVERQVQPEPIVLGTIRRRNIIADMWQDLRYGARMLTKQPGFTLIAVMTLALGIGANTAIFSVVSATLLRPLPFAKSDQLVLLAEKSGEGRHMASFPNFDDWRSRAQSFEGMASVRGDSFNLTGIDKPVQLRGQMVSWNFFQLLGVSPQLGRLFSESEDRNGAQRTALLSNKLWQERFVSDPDIVGRGILLSGDSYTVIGVLPPGFEYSPKDEVYVPIGLSLNPQSGLLIRGNRFGLFAVARLKPSVTPAQANDEMAALGAQLAEEYPAFNSGLSAMAEPLQDAMSEDVRQSLWVLMGAVGFILLIGCVNVANLLLVRASVRRKEIAVRLALGARRSRIVRQMLSESLLLAGLGGAAGLLIGRWMLDGLLAAAPPDLAQLSHAGLNSSVLLFTLGVAGLTSVLCGLVPALHASRPDLQAVLKEGGRLTVGASREGMRKALVVVEVSLAVILLAGAGLLGHSMYNLLQVDPGIDPENLLTMRLELPTRSYDQERRRVFYEECVRRITALPEVRSAALTFSLPIDGSNWNSPIVAADKPAPSRAELKTAAFIPVTPAYFETMGIRLLRGRGFTAADSAKSPLVTVIDETLARRLWPGEDPLGKRLKQGVPEDKNPFREVIGVVTDVKVNGVERETVMEAYLPLTQESLNFLGLAVRTSGDPHKEATAVEQAIHSLDKDLPVFSVLTMDQLLGNAMAQRRLVLTLLASFAALALLLATMGIYGVIAYSVRQRTHETGIRIALGATPRDILRLVIGQGMKLTMIGIALGAAVSLMLTRLLRSLLVGVSPTDPLTFIMLTVLLGLIALAACYIPARRATKVDPMVALRYE